jgi:hypothetical protein
MCIFFFFIIPFVLHVLLCRFGASGLFSSAYGSEATESAGFSLHAWEQVSEMLAAGTQGAFLVVSPYAVCAWL